MITSWFVNISASIDNLEYYIMVVCWFSNHSCVAQDFCISFLLSVQYTLTTTREQYMYTERTLLTHDGFPASYVDTSAHKQ